MTTNTYGLIDRPTFDRDKIKMGQVLKFTVVLEHSFRNKGIRPSNYALIKSVEESKINIVVNNWHTGNIDYMTITIDNVLENTIRFLILDDEASFPYMSNKED